MKLEDWEPYEESPEFVLDVAGHAYLKISRVERMIQPLIDEIARMNVEVAELKNRKPTVIHYSGDGVYE